MKNKLQEYKLQVTVKFPSSVSEDKPLYENTIYLICYTHSISRSCQTSYKVDYEQIKNNNGGYSITLPITDDMIRTIGEGPLCVDVVCEIFDHDFPDSYRTERFTLRTNIIIKL